VPASASVLLRAARESAGLTIDAVAQQLKLAPRQVKAIEDGEFMLLPGRTFVRGFVRNYARLLRLDPESVLGALPAATGAPALESPALRPTAQSIGELPAAERSERGWGRWAIPVTLVAIIAATVIYEQMGPAVDSRRGVAREAPHPPEGAADARAPEIIGTPLPNPVATPGPTTREPPPAEAAAVTPETRAPAPPAVLPMTAPLVLAFRDFSWTTVKDRDGAVLLSRMNPGGTTQAITGAPPLDLVIGNAVDVTLTWKGQPVDLAPHTRQNVARLTLQ
jgi:cytoskeleton protein RodZ